MADIRVAKNEATAARRRVYFFLVDATDFATPETGEAGGQPQVSVDGGAWTNTGIGTLTAIGNGQYYADLTQALVNVDDAVIRTRYKSANTAECPGDTVIVDSRAHNANVTQINGGATNGNNATLSLKMLDISNSTGHAIRAASSAAASSGIYATASQGAACKADGSYAGAHLVGGGIDLALGSAPGVTTPVHNIFSIATSALTVAGSIGKLIVDGWTALTTTRAEKLDNLDAAVTSRLAAAGYAAPPSAADNATAVRSELATELGHIDADITSRLAAADYTAPDNAGIATAASSAGTAATQATEANTHAHAIDGRLPIDPADASVVAGAIAGVPAAVDATLSASHGAGAWGAAVPGWAVVTSDDYGICEDEHGNALANVSIVAYLSTDIDRVNPVSSASSEIDGEWAIYLPPDATYLLVFQLAGQDETTQEVTV